MLPFSITISPDEESKRAPGLALNVSSNTLFVLRLVRLNSSFLFDRKYLVHDNRDGCCEKSFGIGIMPITLFYIRSELRRRHMARYTSKYNITIAPGSTKIVVEFVVLYVGVLSVGLCAVNILLSYTRWRPTVWKFPPDK